MTAADGIIGPNKPTITDVNGDGRNDVIVPAGLLLQRGLRALPPTGSITWWENTASGFVRHDVVTGKVGSYHSAVLTDVDGDGKKDLAHHVRGRRLPGLAVRRPADRPDRPRRVLQGPRRRQRSAHP